MGEVRDWNRDRDYFDKCIEINAGTLSMFRSHLTIIEPERIPLAHLNIAREDLEGILARYSRGDGPGSVAGPLPDMLESWPASGEADCYESAIRFSSAAYLLGAGERALARVAAFLDVPGSRGWDPLVSLVVLGEDPGGEPEWPAHRDLARAARAGSPAEREAAMLRYLRYWYQRHQGCYWWGYDKEEGRSDLYFGYWAVEAAAVARRLGMDDAPLRKSRYYPYDLAHFLDGREG